MTKSNPDTALIGRAVRHLLERGERIKVDFDADEPRFEIDGRPDSEDQVILRAYALGMAEAE